MAVTLSRAANTATEFSMRWACAGPARQHESRRRRQRLRRNPTDASANGCCLRSHVRLQLPARARRSGRARCSEKRGASVTAPPSARPPRLVVAGRLRPLAACQGCCPAGDRPPACRSCSCGAASARAAACSPPAVGGSSTMIVHPAVPFGRHLRGLGQVLVDHPAARHAERADAPALHVVAVAGGIVPTSLPRSAV